MPEYFVKPKLKRETGSLLTTGNNYAIISSFGIRGYKSKTFVLSAATKDLYFRIEFSMNNTDWYNRLYDASVTVGTPVVFEDDSNAALRGHHNYCRVSVKPKVADNNGTGTFVFEGSTL